jgi:hypothetical protein
VGLINSLGYKMEAQENAADQTVTPAYLAKLSNIDHYAR